MPDSIDLRSSVIGAWRTNCGVTRRFVESVPTPLWDDAIPATPRKTVRMLLAHLHNARSRWVRTLGHPHGVAVPALVDMRRVTRSELLAALVQSDAAIEQLLALGLDNGNQIPPTPRYVWRNLPTDVGHVLAYFVAHEAHHRGQLVMIARELGKRLPSPVVNDLWQFTTRQREWSRAR